MTTSDWRPVLDRLDCARGRRVEVRELPGGLSNRVLRVTSVDHGPALDVVVRLPGGDPPATRRGLVFAADRAAEHRNAVLAAEAGLAPPVVESLSDGTLVVVHLDARTLAPADVRADLGRVAALCRRLHAGSRFVGELDLAAVQRRYRALVAQHRTWLPPGHLDLAEAVDRVLAALADPRCQPVGTVPCHNDLPGGNILDDGVRLWLVDFEFAANNDPWCELGNLASGAGLEPDEVEELVTAYAGEPRPDRVARTRLWDAVCSWTWVLWASLQDATSQVDHDYRAMGAALADRAQEQLDPPAVARLIEGLLGPARAPHGPLDRR